MVLLPVAFFADSAVAQTGQASREDLTRIFLAAQDLRQPVIVEGIPDFSTAAVEGQKAELGKLRARLDGLDPAHWPSFRSSFRDWAAECTEAPREVCELALAHVNSDRVEAAYRRSDLFERRRTLMQQWADYLAATA